ncbi:nucleotide exchange factor GrpE [Cohnella thailandensis]|uniref:Protein GrpE n=1 Tax=Cohnella thailandensis TaxID=557557 RepID=A0A841T0X4_9BACL|nr:nucleotide exchange factor GrpE [Cohnella thailandensis]MBB6636205.1 nucleotide exchange factor GrpE [Cohnella thailandensis]
MKEHEEMEQERNAASEEAVQETTEERADSNNEIEAEDAIQEDPRLEELRKQAEEANGRFLRAQADFDNYRRRTLKEKEELAQYASIKLIGSLLPVVDNFGRALATGGESADVQSFAKGVDMIYRQLWQVLEGEGLKEMEAVGQPFDPEFHQAIMQVESDEYEEGTVVEVVQAGYILKDKVIRPAMVKVSG